jgi:hypothetical protein
MVDSAINWLSVGGVLRRFEARTLRAQSACFRSNPGNRAKSSVNERLWPVIENRQLVRFCKTNMAEHWPT